MANAAASATVRPENTFMVGSGLPSGLPGDERDEETDHREFVVYVATRAPVATKFNRLTPGQNRRAQDYHRSTAVRPVPDDTPGT